MKYQEHEKDATLVDDHRSSLFCFIIEGFRWHLHLYMIRVFHVYKNVYIYHYVYKRHIPTSNDHNNMWFNITLIQNSTQEITKIHSFCLAFNLGQIDQQQPGTLPRVFLISYRRNFPQNATLFVCGVTVDGWNPAPVDTACILTIIYRVLYIPGGAGFQPSTGWKKGFQNAKAPNLWRSPHFV